MIQRKIHTSNEPFTNCRDCEVRSSTLFRNVPEDQLDQTQVYRRRQIDVPPRTVLFQEGDKLDELYTVYSGWGIIFKTVKNNKKRQILRFLLPGDFFGFQTNYLGNVTCSAASLSKMKLCTFSSDGIEEMMTENPDLAMRLVQIESNYLSQCQSHLLCAGRKTARDSVATLLLELFYSVKLQCTHCYDATNNSIEFPLTQEDIGDAVGLTNVHVNRIVKELSDENLLTIHKKHLVLHKENALIEMVDFDPETMKPVPLL